MHSLAVTFSDAVGFPSGYTKSAGDLVLAKTGSLYLQTFPLYKTQSFRMTAVSSLSFIGTNLVDAFFFPVIDGIVSRYDGAAFVPVLASAFPSTYPALAMSASTVDLATFQKIFLDGRPHQVGLALCFRSIDGSTTPALTSFGISYASEPADDVVHYTRVFGNVAIDHGFPHLTTFKVDLNRKTVIYGNTILSPRDIIVTVASDGSWEIYLPDTDSMGDTAYSFRFDPVYPIVRKVPKVAEIEFRSLPYSAGA